MILYLLIAVFLGMGAWVIICSALFHERSLVGRASIRSIGKWQKEKQEIWDSPILRRIIQSLSRFVFLDDTAKETLSGQLSRAGMNLSPQQFTARKYIVIGLGAIAISICAASKFWIGVILTGLLVGYALMAQRDKLLSRIQKRDEAISMEMPRFVRTMCRSLRSNRDIFAALQSYRKVAGPTLGEELDILIAHMRSGGTAAALQQFQRRIGTDSAFRLCSTLQEIDRGIDQTGTLEYLADDMARQAKLNIQKALSTRPAKMRRTYLPAVGVCIIMILYVLIVFVKNQLNILL